MFDILKKSLRTGVVTTAYPAIPAQVSSRSRGRPEIDWANWKDARRTAAVCPTGAISYADTGRHRTATLDLSKCTFCGLCAEADKAFRMTTQCECAARSRAALVSSAEYSLKADGTHNCLLSAPSALQAKVRRLREDSKLRFEPEQTLQARTPSSSPASVEEIGSQLKSRINEVLGRSLHIREVDAGSCNGCEVEINGLNSPIYDIERFGIHFVASPRHADMLLVTGPVTRNMELAVRKTYDATPEPRVVVAVGACGCSGGIFGVNYATCGGVDSVIPVDVYISGCPPNPHALLQGILLAVGRWKKD